MTKPTDAYLGTFTDGESEGVYHCVIDRDSGRVDLRGATAAGANPSFLAVAPDGNHLYAVNEDDPGTVTALAVGEAGVLSVLDRVENGGRGPAHVSVDATGSTLLVSDYHGGVLSMVPITDAGGLAAPTQVLELGRDAKVHAAVPGPDNRVAYVAVLGHDEFIVYDMDVDAGELAEKQRLSVPSGAGPRNVAIHPDGSVVYLLCEHQSVLLAYERRSDGTLAEGVAVDTLPGDASGENYPAEVQVHEAGEFLFVSNRGADTIATFDVSDPARPVLDGQTDCGGAWPRHFALAPDGRYLFVANQESDDVRTFAVGETGELEPTGDVVEVPAPVCLAVNH